YTPGFAAKMMSLLLMIAGLGKLLMGVLADRVSARRALAFNFLGTTLLVFKHSQIEIREKA
ncbi:MAG: hypothetical protein WB999_09830, partial [Candidatus Binataceae bacterium]